MRPRPRLLRTIEDSETGLDIAGTAPELASICGIDQDRRVLVQLAGGAGPVPARLATHLDRGALLRAVVEKEEVLVIFARADRGRPIIVGLVEDRLSPEPQTPDPTAAAPAGLDAQVDGRRVRIVGHDEIVLVCGKASITLRRNGRVVVRGTQVETDADGVNRIKGASVRIN